MMTNKSLAIRFFVFMVGVTLIYGWFLNGGTTQQIDGQIVEQGEKQDVASSVPIQYDEKLYEAVTDSPIRMTKDGRLMIEQRKIARLDKAEVAEIVHGMNGSHIKQIDEAFKKSKRVNVLALGVEEDPRSDTIILMSFDPEKKQLDLLSIPRDTYYRVPGYNRLDHRKINAAYARSREKGAVSAVQNLLGIPVHHYVTIRYAGVEAIVDILGGVEVEVPEWMPGLPGGKQVLTGKQSIIYLRGRYGYRNGDLGRVQAQQQFIKAAVEKSIGFKLPSVIKAAFKYVHTDMGLKEILYYGVKAVGMDTEKITMQTLPGRSDLYQSNGHRAYYYYHDATKTRKIIEKIYNVKE